MISRLILHLEESDPGVRGQVRRDGRPSHAAADDQDIADGVWHGFHLFNRRFRAIPARSPFAAHFAQALAALERKNMLDTKNIFDILPSWRLVLAEVAKYASRSAKGGST
jgi:hypothetical protein